MIPYIIKTFRGGISDESDKGIDGSFKHGHNLDVHSKDDVLKCGSIFVVSSEETVSDLIQFFVPSTDGSLYGFGNGGSIYVRAGGSPDVIWNLAYKDDEEIKGAGELTGSDGTTFIYWATQTSIVRRDMTNGAKDIPWTNSSEYKVEKISTDAPWHTMSLASGQLNIANGQGLATQTYGGTFDPYELLLRPGNYVNTIEERDDYILLGSSRQDGSEEGHIWSWITTATNYIQKKRIPVQGVNAMIDTEQLLLQGGDNGELFYSDFVNSIPIAKINGGGRVNPGGVSILDDLAVFGFYGGTYPGIWSYGRRNKNRPNILNYEYRLAQTIAGSSISTIGAVTVFNGDLFASWGTTDGSTSDYGVDQVSSTTKANAIYEGLEFDGGSPHLSKFVDSIMFLMSPLPTGCSVSAKFKMDKESDWRYAVLGDNTTTFSVANETVAIFNITKPGRIYEVGVELTANGASSPEIHAITSYLSKESSDYA